MRREGHYERVTSPTTPVAPTGIDSLSDRELEVLRMIGQGQSTAEVAGQLHLSVHTIETYRQRIKGKLALKNPAELARVAVQWVLEHG